MDTANLAHGIDVSHYNTQGSPTDWDAVLNSGVSFVGIKTSQGNTYTDPMFRVNSIGVRVRPFSFVTYYHFAAPGDPVAQAERFMGLVGDLHNNERLCLDLEDDKTGKPSVDLVWASKFYGSLMRGVCSNRKPLLYTSRRIWLQLGNPTWDLASELDLWAPRYGPDQPELPLPWKPYGWRFLAIFRGRDRAWHPRSMRRLVLQRRRRGAASVRGDHWLILCGTEPLLMQLIVMRAIDRHRMMSGCNGDSVSGSKMDIQSRYSSR